MYRSLLIILFNLISFIQLQAQLTQSNLPIIIIDTQGSVSIQNDPKVSANMKIIYRGEGQQNFVTDKNNADFLDFDGWIRIETRGSSSQDLDKKPYGFTTYDEKNDKKDDVGLLDMPKDNDWILNSLAYDPSLIRDYISYHLSRELGQYATRTRFCELVINGNYLGLYILQEKIKAGSKRVDINKIGELDKTEPNITGGYITKTDKDDKGETAWTMETASGNGSNFIHVVPKPEDAIVSQTNYIKSEFDKLQARIINNNTSLSNGYPAVIDIPSFIDFMLVNELSSNVDAYTFSTYFHKDRNGKLRAGPIWDLNLTYGNDLFIYGLDRSFSNVWQFDNGDNVGPLFWKKLYENPTFKCQMAKRWNELTSTGMPMNLAVLSSKIDETVSLISGAVSREQNKWGTVPNHNLEISNMKSWLSDRINWMTNELGSTSLCANPSLPSLVISKINYHPKASTENSSSSQEFIELLNNGSSIADLTGVYFGGTGFVYQFPANATLAAGARMVLANNLLVYKDKYEVDAFGQFSRSLSNDGQTLTLRDGLGNIIDELTYNDKLPWPEKADGDGFYLELKDVNSDNNDAINWTATADVDYVLSSPSENKFAINVYPNPTKDKFGIDSKSLILSLQIMDVQGRILNNVTVNNETFAFDIANYQVGIYLLTVKTSQGYSRYRIVKE